MDKGRDTGHREGPPFENDLEVMPDSDQQQAPLWRRKTPKTGGFWRLERSIRLLTLLVAFLLPCLALAASTTPEGNGKNKKKTDPNGHDIAVVIDNRDIAGSSSAKEDVKALTEMLDRHMFADHIVRLERPSFAVICDIFGGCPDEAGQTWPSLIDQITDRGRSRLYVYYLGPGRIEGRERQFLFESGPGRESPYAVGWLHKQLEKTGPKSALVIMETSFSPRPLPCASEDPELIDEAMTTVRRNYARLMAGRSLPRGLAELSAAMPAEVPHCDRYELTSDDVKRPLFTKFLLNGVVEGLADKEPFGDEDGTIELGELAAFTHEKIKRAVQFQWGRTQNVWRVGPGSRALARVEARASTFKEKKVRATKSEPKEKPPEKKIEVRAKPDVDVPDVDPPDPIEKGKKAPDLHVCDQDQQGEACIDFCTENPDDFRCPFIGVSVCQGQPVSNACPCVQDDPRPDCSNTGTWCRWSSAELSQGTESVIAAVGGSPDDACQWATRNESDIESGPLWDLFAPIGWRLIRPLVRLSFACMLNCQGRARQVTASLASDELSSLEPALAPEPVSLETAPRDQPLKPIDRPPRTAFAEEICDQSQPPYIGLPRWMPGTLMISETLRFFSDCGPPPDPVRFARGLPAPVALLEAPSLPEARYEPPPPFGMPPPIKLPPVQPTAVVLPPFEPTVSEIRWLQSALMLGNHNPGSIDGAIGAETNAAVRSWRKDNDVERLEGDLTEDEFIRIVRQFGEKFDQVVPDMPLY